MGCNLSLFDAKSLLQFAISFDMSGVKLLRRCMQMRSFQSVDLLTLRDSLNDWCMVARNIFLLFLSYLNRIA